MRKNLTMVSVILVIFSIFIISAVQSFALDTDVKLTKISGDLESPGDIQSYLITDGKGNPISDFSKKYVIEKDLKLPLTSEVKNTKDGTVIDIKVMDTCSTEVIELQGTIKIVDINDKTKSVEVFNAKGKTVKNKAINVSGDISISSNTGNKLYDFSGASGNIRIYFGEDATIETHGIETGDKCLSYSINPNQAIKTKYSLNSSNSAFVNFIGSPEFNNNITIKFAVPVDSSTPKLYQLKEGTTNELEEIGSAKVSGSGSDMIIYFETDKLLDTYVITSEPLKGVSIAEPLIKEPEIQEPVVTEPIEDTNNELDIEETQVPEVTVPEEPVIDDTEKSPQTGSNVITYAIYVVLASALLVAMIVCKKIY